MEDKYGIFPPLLKKGKTLANKQSKKDPTLNSNRALACFQTGFKQHGSVSPTPLLLLLLFPKK
jgi:hypothetical protein